MSKIIEIKPIPEYLNITWIQSNFCNYECMYCPTQLHSNTSELWDLETMQTAWRNIHEKTRHQKLPYRIGLSGGEPTANKNFLPFAKWLKQNYQDIEVFDTSTNGTASTRYYQELLDWIDSLNFSFHSEFADEKEWVEKAIAVSATAKEKKKFFHAVIMDEYWNQERIPLITSILDEHDVFYTVNKIDYSIGCRDWVKDEGGRNIEFFEKSRVL